MEEFYPEAIYHGIVYFPTIDTSEKEKIKDKNIYKVFQLNKGKMNEVSTGLNIEDLATDFSMKMQQGALPRGQILQYLSEKEGIKSPLTDKLRQYSLTPEPEKITPVSSEEQDKFRKYVFNK